MAFFAYTGDHAETRVFGLAFPAGEPVEVTDAHAVQKLRGNRDFIEVFDGVEIVMPEHAEPKRRGRTPKVR